MVPYLYVDASLLYKVRDGARYVTKAALVVAGVPDAGYREILGARITDCVNEEFWSGLFEDLPITLLTDYYGAVRSLFFQSLSSGSLLRTSGRKSK